jgi:hypothetical protein
MASQKMAFFSVTAVKTSNRIKERFVVKYYEKLKEQHLHSEYGCWVSSEVSDVSIIQCGAYTQKT